MGSSHKYKLYYAVCTQFLKPYKHYLNTSIMRRCSLQIVHLTSRLYIYCDSRRLYIYVLNKLKNYIIFNDETTEHLH